MSGKIQLYLGEPSPKVKTWIERHHAPPLPYDAEIMYLESTGTQWIDTGIYGRTGLLVRIRAMPIQSYVYGTLTGRTYLIFRLAADGSYFSGSAWSPNVNFLDFPVSSGAIHEILADTTNGNKFVAIDGTIVNSWTSPNEQVGKITLGLFAYHTNAMTESNYGQSRIYSFSVTDATTGQKIQDLIPVRKNGVGYMYDKVSGNLLGNSGTGDLVLGPDKPYDYEVEYIERNCSVPWVDAGGNEILGYFNLSCYGDADETLGTMRPLEATWSFEPISVGYAYAIVRQHVLLMRGCQKPTNHTTYDFAPQDGQHSEIEGNIGTFHKQRMIYQDGNIKGYIDGILVVDTSITGTAKVKDPRVLYTTISTNSAHYNGKARMKNARIGSDVYLIPVVKGNAVGFCNMVDGHLFLEEQACLSAGP